MQSLAWARFRTLRSPERTSAEEEGVNMVILPTVNNVVLPTVKLFNDIAHVCVQYRPYCNGMYYIHIYNFISYPKGLFITNLQIDKITIFCRYADIKHEKSTGSSNLSLRTRSN